MKTEDKKYHNNNPYILFEKDESFIEFSDGEIEFSAQSPHWGSDITLLLNTDRTKQLYLVMKEYYEDYKDEEAMKIIHEAAEEIKKRGL